MNEFLMTILHSEVEMPGHTVGALTTLQDNTKLFSKGVASVYTPTRST